MGVEWLPQQNTAWQFPEYGLTWGSSNSFTGRLSHDRRRHLSVPARRIQPAPLAESPVTRAPVKDPERY